MRWQHINSFPIRAYIVLACVISWSCSIVGPLNFLSVYGPAFAALLILTILQGFNTTLSYLKQLLPRWPFSLWYLFLPTVFLLAAAGSFWVAGIPPSPIWSTLQNIWPTFFILLFVELITVGFGEELGWRGFLLPRLQSQYHPLRATLLLFMAWTLWHLPKFLFLNDRFMLIPLMVSLLAFSILFTWLYNRTSGDLFCLALAHSAANVSIYLFEPLIVDFQIGTIEFINGWIIFALIFLLISIIIAVATKGRLAVALPPDARE